MVTMAAPVIYIQLRLNPLITQSPTMAKGIVIDNPTVTVNGLVNITALHQQKSLMNVMNILTNNSTKIWVSLGTTKVSTLVK